MLHLQVFRTKFEAVVISSHCRVRKIKERYAITEIRKQANRMTFGSVCSLCTYVQCYSII